MLFLQRQTVFVLLLTKVMQWPSVSLFLTYNTQRQYCAYGYSHDDQQQNYGIMIHGDPFSSSKLKQQRCQTANVK